MDLHTATGPIEREDLNITLDGLHLSEEAKNGAVELYAVIRQIEPENRATQPIWKDIFSFANAWVFSDLYMANFRNSLPNIMNRKTDMDVSWLVSWNLWVDSTGQRLIS